jgi:hypothetical protein
MPTLADFIRAEKQNIDAGKWAVGHVQRTSFPMSGSKPKHYRFGQEYSWRVVKFDCLSHRCRVLILINENKRILISCLGVEVGKDLAVLCAHEYHASHEGWHCHLHSQDLSSIPAGIFRTGMRRWPRGGTLHSQLAFGVTKASALSHVAARFRFPAQGSLL